MPLLFLLLLDAASGEVLPPVPEPIPAGGFAPQTRSEWEAARARQESARLALLPAPAPEPAPIRTPRTWKDPFAAVIAPQPAPVPLAVVQQLQVETPANFEASDEELAAVALVLTARLNAYRWACTGQTQPLRAA